MSRCSRPIVLYKFVPISYYFTKYRILVHLVGSWVLFDCKVLPIVVVWQWICHLSVHHWVNRLVSYDSDVPTASVDRPRWPNIFTNPSPPRYVETFVDVGVQGRGSGSFGLPNDNPLPPYPPIDTLGVPLVTSVILWGVTLGGEWLRVPRRLVHPTGGTTPVGSGKGSSTVVH